MLAAILALAITALVYQLSSARIFFDDDEHPAFPEYEKGLDVALLVGVTVRRDRKTPLQGVLPLSGQVDEPVRKKFQQLHLSAALTGDPGGGTFLAPQFASAGSDEDPMRAQALTQLGFAKAASVWLETRRPYIAEETFRNYGYYIQTLTAFFVEMKLQGIDGDQVRAFQRARLASVSAGEINKECSVLIQMRKRIGLPLVDYQPLPVSKESPGRALTVDEDKALSVAGKFQNELEPAHLFVLISKNTGGGPKEIRGVRLKDINLEERLIYFPRSAAKNEYRMREVPLNQTAFAAVCRALEIAVTKGAKDPDHYLFPFRVKRDQWDVTRPQKSFRKAWAKICEFSGIRHLRMYDLRHHAATNMLSDPRVPPEAAIEVLGHVSKQMLKRYCHLNREAKRAAVEALERKAPSPVQIPRWLLKKA
jgi:integrase